MSQKNPKLIRNYFVNPKTFYNFAAKLIHAIGFATLKTKFMVTEEVYKKEYDVIIVGGGATGAGTARDCALRGLKVLLVERNDYSTGATGRNHGLMHSGAPMPSPTARALASASVRT